MFSKIGYALKQALAQTNRNKGVNFAAVLAITAMMLILGIFFVAFVNVNLFANVISQDYNVVNVYLGEDNDDATNSAIEEQIKDMNGVEKVEYRSKEDALKIMKQRWGDNGYLLDNLDSNPLPDSYLVYVKDKSAADSVATAAKNITGVDDVNYYQDTIAKLAKATRFIRNASAVVMVFLIVVSVIIVANTIKLTVFNRSKEIGIMKYLGATDWFVRGPFLLEGIILGFVSAAAASVLMYVVYGQVISVIGKDIMRIFSVPVVPSSYLIPNLVVIFAALGIGIGTFGSIISIRRFLQK